MLNCLIDPAPDQISEEAPPKTPEPEWVLYQPTALDLSSAYDFPDDALDREFAPNPRAKRRRDDDSPLNPMDGIKSRIPSFSRSLSRKWRSRKATPTIAMPDRSQEQSLSRANSTRAPSLAGSAVEAGDSKGVQLPPTPARTAFDHGIEDSHVNSMDTYSPHTSQDNVVDQEAKPTTPLLPPILTQFPDHIREVPYQSPLQSPTVADPEASSVLNTPLPTPRIAGLPSPPLSSKPSISSFHRQRGIIPISPSSDIPPLLITNPNDRWANELGHANFTITPEPYIPEESTAETCKQLRVDWDAARFNYMKQLMRTGEHYGTTSKIHRLTEEKWAEIESLWKRNVEGCRSRLPPERRSDPAGSSTYDDMRPEPTPLMKMPSLNGPKSEGKFPTIGDEGIVGPMEQIPSLAQQPHRKKRKLGLLRWMQGVWPARAGVLGRRSSSGP